jgi:osmoprotectant transport system permease protein
VNDEPLVRWDWVASHLDDVWARTIEHLHLTAVAVGVGFVIAMVLSVLALRWRWTFTPITWFTGILYTVPSIAFFALLVPFTGLSMVTAEVGLVSYTLLILVRNIVAGVDGVPASVREAATGMGFRRVKLFTRVEFPLALPVVIAGVRIATVTTIGLVTITALIGLGGYGAFINDGLKRFFWTPLVLGAVLSVAMAVAMDLILVGVERVLTPWARRRVA